MTSATYIPSAGDLIWTDFDPTKGREQAGRRPGLVVSSAVFSKNTGLAVVCPNYFARATVSYEYRSSVRPAYRWRNPDQPHS